jgi:DNA polymerase I-like protein with 3'-5' exonuclease and polymerase domains
MKQCDYDAKSKGQVKTVFGRIRHLNEVRSIAQIYGDKILDYKWANSQGLKDKRRAFKTGLNNAKNFRIQGLAAHIINRSMIALASRIEELGLNAYIALMIHDQVVCIASDEHAEKVKEIMQICMENTVKLSIPLTAEPQIALNLADSH